MNADWKKRFGLHEAIVALFLRPTPTPLTSQRGGRSLPVRDGSFDMRIGVGWGRTLVNSLAYMSEKAVENVSIVSLLGGIMKARTFNPAEFAWRFASHYQATAI
ncbi:sugar-binding domain-containing protein [Paraburkholderia dipogonis]|uniref:sugar-binding domain-containing protein n=1 Tax=Paraburkholderia dipogonis TaxID=1211383 RepID=UPI0035E4C933